MNLELFAKELIRDEKLVTKPYQDSLGIWTVGVGHNLNKPLTERACKLIQQDDTADALADLDRNAPWWVQLDERRQHALANMCFNMGWPRLSQFHNMLEALEAKNYPLAADEALNSKWATQVGTRAVLIASVLRNG